MHEISKCYSKLAQTHIAQVVIVRGIIFYKSFLLLVRSLPVSYTELRSTENDCCAVHKSCAILAYWPHTTLCKLRVSQATGWILLTAPSRGTVHGCSKTRIRPCISTAARSLARNGERKKKKNIYIYLYRERERFASDVHAKISSHRKQVLKIKELHFFISSSPAEQSPMPDPRELRPLKGEGF